MRLARHVFARLARPVFAMLARRCEAGQASVRLAKPVFVSPMSPQNDDLDSAFFVRGVH